MTRLVAAIAFLLVAGWCHAEKLCAIESGALYDVAPTPGKELPREAGKLQKGHIYAVTRDGAGWTLLDTPSTQLWTERKHLDIESRCSSKQTPATSAKSTSREKLSLQATPTSSRSSISNTSSGCPCGSGHVCIGPRGGRYCITSGGNKRYGV